MVYKKTKMVWGIECFMMKFTRSHDILWNQIIKVINDNKVASKGDTVVIVSGSLVGVSGKTDAIKIATI